MCIFTDGTSIVYHPGVRPVFYSYPRGPRGWVAESGLVMRVNGPDSPQGRLMCGRAGRGRRGGERASEMLGLSSQERAGVSMAIQRCSIWLGHRGGGYQQEEEEREREKEDETNQLSCVPATTPELHPL